MSILWTPAAIQTALWLDAADSATITTVSGAVSQWSDKSGYGRHATQGTAGSRPTVVANAINSRNAIAFSTKFMTFGNGVTITPQMTFVAVITRPSSGSLTITLTTSVEHGYPYSTIIWTNDKFYTALGSDYIISEATYTNTGAMLLSAQRNSTTLIGLLNGSQVVSGAAPSVSGSLTYLGRWGAGTDYHAGNIAEIVVAPTSDTTHRQLIEGYLAHKWGLSGNLPSTHPYKSAAPLAKTISNANTTAILDDTGSPCARTILAVPRNYPTNAVIKTASDSNGRYEVAAVGGVPYDVIIMDDDTGTQYSDILISRVMPE